jgi:hypothetical protein
MKPHVVLLVRLGVLFSVASILGCATPIPESEMSWKEQFNAHLGRMGKNNWIVVSDAAYTSRHVEGTQMLATHKSLTSVLGLVLDKISDSDHVYATAWISSELEHIPDRDALGITQTHKEIRRLLNAAKVETKVLPESEILKKLEGDAATCNVLILKSITPLPYSSIWLQLDCRYWDEAREKRLRDALRGIE